MTLTKQIKSMDDLKAEHRRLKAEIAEKEQFMRTEFEAVKDSLKPLNVATNFLSKFISTKEHNLVNDGVSGAVSFLLRNVVLARAGWITKLVVPYIAKNYANNKLTENKGDIVHSLRDWLHKYQDKRSKRVNGQYDRSTSDIDL